MREELGQIDLSPIADLVRIKGEEEVLAERLANMESRKEKVTALVYRRVRADYETRKAALEAESRPLKERARREFAKLQVLLEKAERGVEETSLEKEELEFRRELGEFPDSQFREKQAALERKLAEREADLEAVVETRGKFVAAFHTEAELEGAEAPVDRSPAPVERSPAPVERSPAFVERSPAAVARPPAPATPPPASVERQTASTAPLPVAPQPPPPPPAAPQGRFGPVSVPPPPPPEAMRWGPVAAPPIEAMPPEPAPAIEATVLEPGAVRPGAPPAGGIPGEAPGPTVVLTIPRLVVLVDGKPGKEHVLKPGITTLGRSPKTDIQVLFSEVSRTHAEVVWEADGFIVLDLDSENGVYVNGERVKKKHALKDGDTVQIGPQKFLFRV